MEQYDDNEYNSDEEINVKQHARLVNEVFQLDKTQYVKKPSRTEPVVHVSEFNLVKPATGRKNVVSINQLTKALQKKNKHVSLSKKVKSAQKKSNTLLKPLAKTQAERIRRSIGFKKIKTELGKWDAIVEKNRVASQLIFPLNQGEVDFVDSKITRNEYQPRYKSELDIELEKLEPVEPKKVEEKQFPLSMAELIQRRKEMAKLRALQSYQEAKAYKQNKIKSKSFHRILRKEKLKLKIREFELLQKTDPEAALRKLEELEKVRAEERMSLRHRSTGQWAKNKQIQAKYNKESRQALAQQLALSRELTQKMKVNDSSESETEEVLPEKLVDTSNPWIANRSAEVNDFISGYRKFWNEQNKGNSEQNQQQNTESNKNDTETLKNYNEIVKYDESVPPKTQNTQTSHSKKEITKIKKPKKNTKKVNKSKPVSFCNSNWDVEDLFEELESKTRKKLQDKLNKLKTITSKKKSVKKQNLKLSREIENKIDLSMPREKLRPEIDEELGINEEENDEIKETMLKTIDKMLVKSTTDTSKDVNGTNKYASVKTVDLDTQLPTISIGNDHDNDEEENDQRAFISEAFEDDDIVADFSKEKQDIIDDNKPKDIDLSLPGWGSWAGQDIQMSKRKRKRFIIKLPKELPRRDKNKGDLIINEHKNEKLKKHQVSELPFPFKTVRDFEASVRAPIGDTFVPQTAFRRLIKPPIIVKKGTIIEPMSEDILLKQKFTQNGFLVNR